MDANKFIYRMMLHVKSFCRLIKEAVWHAPFIQNPQTILIAATSLLGDFILVAPLVQGVKKKYPKARIGLLVPSGFSDLARHMIGVDEVIEVSKNDAKWFRHFCAAEGKKWDWAIVGFLYSVMPMLYASGVKNIVSYPDIRGRNYQIHHKVNLPKKVAHMSRLMLEVIGDEVGIYPAPHFKKIEGDLPKGVKQPYVIIHPGASRETRFWPAERYIAIAKRLIAKGYHIVLSGGPPEMHLCEPIEKALEGGGVTNCAGKTNLLNLGVLVQSAKAVIGPDTSIMHLARAMRIPNVTIMGPTQREVYGLDPHFHDVSRARTLYIPNLACRDDATVFGASRKIPGVGNCYRDACLYKEIPCLLKVDIQKVEQALVEIGVL